MYNTGLKNYLNRIHFALCDLVCLNIAFVIAYELRIGGANPYGISLYRDMLIVLCLANIAVISVAASYADIEKRGYYKEFIALATQVGLVFLLSVLYLFSVQEAEKFSRLTLLIMSVVFLVLNYAARLLWKHWRKKYQVRYPSRSLLVVTNEKNAEDILQSLFQSLDTDYLISGIVVIDRAMAGQEIINCPIVCDVNALPQFVCHNWVDDILFITDDLSKLSQKMLVDLAETGVVLHYGVLKKNDMLTQKQFVEVLGGYTVVTSCMNQARPLELLIKRAFDIFAGLVGCLVTGLLCLLLALAIKLASPGPLFFAQTRIGMNGKKFKMYRLCVNSQGQSLTMAYQKRCKRHTACLYCIKRFYKKLTLQPVVKTVIE